MARPLRIEYPNAAYHVYDRGHQKRKIFLDKQDYWYFLNCIDEVYRSNALIVLSFCLMPNHFHLYVETPNADLQRAMHKLKLKYSSYFKKKYDYHGTLYEGRYNAILVESDSYALILSRYIHLNPVEHLVDKMEDWTWSSYRAFIDKKINFDFLDRTAILKRLDVKYEEAVKKFVKFSNEFEGLNWRIEDHVVAKCLLGSEVFQERIKNEFLPDEVDTNVARLACLKADAKLNDMKSYISNTFLDAKSKQDFLLYAIRKKTYLQTKDYTREFGNLSTAGLSNRVRRFVERSRSNKLLRVTIEDFDRRF